MLARKLRQHSGGCLEVDLALHSRTLYDQGQASDWEWSWPACRVPQIARLHDPLTRSYFSAVHHYHVLKKTNSMTQTEKGHLTGSMRISPLKLRSHYWFSKVELLEPVELPVKFYILHSSLHSLITDAKHSSPRVDMKRHELITVCRHWPMVDKIMPKSCQGQFTPPQHLSPFNTSTWAALGETRGKLFNLSTGPGTGQATSQPQCDIICGEAAQIRTSLIPDLRISLQDSMLKRRPSSSIHA